MPPPAFIVHNPAHVLAVLEAAQETQTQEITFWSACNAPLYQGTAWFRLMIEDLAQRFSHIHCHIILDCGDSPGSALAALNAPSSLTVALPDGPQDVQNKIAAIATAMGKSLTTSRPYCYDLLHMSDPRLFCTTVLQTTRD